MIGLCRRFIEDNECLLPPVDVTCVILIRLYVTYYSSYSPYIRSIRVVYLSIHSCILLYIDYILVIIVYTLVYTSITTNICCYTHCYTLVYVVILLLFRYTTCISWYNVILLRYTLLTS